MRDNERMSWNDENERDRVYSIAIFALSVILGTLIAVFVWGGTVAEAVELEDGATFDGGICWEADGTEGISTIDGQCMTPADYDETFSYEALAATPSHSDPSRSVADVYGIEPDGPRASERVRTFMGDELGTFTDYVVTAHGQVVGL